MEDWFNESRSLQFLFQHKHITDSNFEIYTDTFDELSFEELKDELEEILNFSDITPYNLQHEKKRQRDIEAFKKLKLEKSSTDGYNILLLGYATSPFRDFESYTRIVVSLNEDDIQLILKHYNSSFASHESSPIFYTIKDISEAIYTMGDHEGTLQIDYDDISMRAKLILTRFGGTSEILRFDERSSFKTFLGFTPYWDFKPTNAAAVDSPVVYTSDKFLNLITIDKIHLKSYCIDALILDGKRQPILFSFVLNKPSGYKMLCEPETKQHKKKQKNLFCIL